MLDLNGEIGANKDFTFIFVGLERNFDNIKTVTLKNLGYDGTSTDDVLIFDME